MLLPNASWISVLRTIVYLLWDHPRTPRGSQSGWVKIFKHERKSSWVPTRTGPFPNGRENAGS